MTVDPPAETRAAPGEWDCQRSEDNGSSGSRFQSGYLFIIKSESGSGQQPAMRSLPGYRSAYRLPPVYSQALNSYSRRLQYHQLVRLSVSHSPATDRSKRLKLCSHRFQSFHPNKSHGLLSHNTGHHQASFSCSTSLALHIIDADSHVHVLTQVKGHPDLRIKWIGIIS